ncbi:ABC transporter permease [Afifella sp. IM 167]|uniref:ABC transporter permease n=1 Tax=Afifella sp. IM 167 TaxID=2033586 RepID=UPI001CCA75DE|nr:ABC transporter permease [Afifella sp. IM 167]MBZ8132911.1 ABC transporter permease [Afifella sp. IM 167]
MSSTAPIAEPGGGVGLSPRIFVQRIFAGKTGPVLTVLAALVILWYAGAVYLNAPQQIDRDRRAEIERSVTDFMGATWAQERPVLPAPHQVAAEIWKTTFAMNPTSKRSLVYHGWVTLSSTLTGFGIGVLLGIVLAVGIVYSRTLDRSLMPWIITSQTIPILAIAPMIVVVLGSLDVAPIFAKGTVSAYLAFFPVAVGMVKGLRSPDPMLLDLMRTYSASNWQTLVKLRLPSAMPFLFASLKVAIAISLVGAIVGELPTGARAGLGARLLAGSYYGQTVQIWSALLVAAFMAAILVTIVGFADRLVLKRMGIAE